MSTSGRQSLEAGPSSLRDYDYPLPENANKADQKAVTDYKIGMLSDNSWSKYNVWELFT